MPAIDELRQFHEFVGRQLHSSNSALTPEQCLAAWRDEHPLPAGFAESVADLQAAIDEMEHGDSGVPARSYLTELRLAHGLAPSPRSTVSSCCPAHGGRLTRRCNG